MKLRAITGFFFVIVMLGSVLLGPKVFTAFYLVLSVLCLQEFYSLVKKSATDINTFRGLVTGFFTFGLIAVQFYADERIWLFFLIILFCMIFISELYRKSETPFTSIGYTFLGLFFTITPFVFFHALGFAGGDFNFHIPLGFMLMLWANDTGAYLVGTQIGKHRLFERHSPKKSWEGFIGGIIIAAGVGYLLSIYYTELAWQHWVVIGLIIGIFGTAGDLIESMFKRSINVKDSGGILPGHGGLLDRFDGLLLAAPMVYAYLYIVLNP